MLGITAAVLARASLGMADLRVALILSAFAQDVPHPGRAALSEF
jgi:hypothetical protein